MVSFNAQRDRQALSRTGDKKADVTGGGMLRSGCVAGCHGQQVSGCVGRCLDDFILAQVQFRHSRQEWLIRRECSVDDPLVRVALRWICFTVIRVVVHVEVLMPGCLRAGSHIQPYAPDRMG